MARSSVARLDRWVCARARKWVRDAHLPTAALAVTPCTRASLCLIVRRRPLQTLTFFESVLAKGFVPAPASEELAIERARKERQERARLAAEAEEEEEEDEDEEEADGVDYDLYESLERCVDFLAGVLYEAGNEEDDEEDEQAETGQR